MLQTGKTHYGIRCMVMPYVIAGSQNPEQRELDFCIHYRYETQKAILNDLVASLYAQGYRKWSLSTDMAAIHSKYDT